VVERSDDRVSHPAGYYRQCISASLLTPDSLRCPTLSAEVGKEGSCNFFMLRTKRLNLFGKTNGIFLKAIPAIMADYTDIR